VLIVGSSSSVRAQGPTNHFATDANFDAVFGGTRNAGSGPAISQQSGYEFFYAECSVS